MKKINSTPYTLHFSFNSSKKGIGPVIAIALLIVVTVTSVIGFQTWFKTYQQNIENKAESTDSISINLNYIENSGTSMILYYHNPSLNYVLINSLKINSIDCTIIGSEVLAENTITQIEVTGCDVEIKEKAKTVLITPIGIFQEEILVK